MTFQAARLRAKDSETGRFQVIQYFAPEGIEI
jgi:hypothetical protein